jgi:hypothetical protein
MLDFALLPVAGRVSWLWTLIGNHFGKGERRDVRRQDLMRAEAEGRRARNIALLIGGLALVASSAG